MKKIDEAIENYFAPKEKKPLGMSALVEMINEEMSKIESSLLTEMATDEEIRDYLPTIKITEAWGQPGSKDRQIIEEFSRNIKGSTVEEKLKYLSNVLEGTSAEKLSLGEILGTLVMIEVLNSILVEFTESAGGFIFEAFLAGLFGNSSVQITGGEDDETGATGKPITDVRLGGKEYSLKLLGDSTDVKGSFKNMIEHFKVKDHIIYLDARRTSEGLMFGEFEITIDSFVDVFVTPFLKAVYKKEAEDYENAKDFQALLSKLSDEEMAIKRIKSGRPGLLPQAPKWQTFDFSRSKGIDLTEGQLNNQGMASFVQALVNMDSDALQEYAPFSIIYAETKFENTKAEKLFGSYAIVEQLLAAIKSGNRDKIFQSLEMTPGYQKSEQFIFTKNQVEEGIKNFRHVGFLPVNETSLKKAWLNYGELLNETLRPVYGTLNIFTKNINSYFLSSAEGEGDRKQHGVEAIKNAVELRDATDKAVSAIEETEN